MAYKLTPDQYKDIAVKRIENKNTAENTNSAVSAYARALNASRALDNKNKQAAVTQPQVQASDSIVLRSLSTVLAPVLRLSEGVAKFVENSILDMGAGLTASVLDIVGADGAAQDVQDFAAQDIIGDAFDWRPIEQIYQNSYSNEWGDFGEILQEGIYSVGQQAIPFGLSFLGGPWLSAGAFALGGYGGGFEDASQDGGEVLGASAYGLVSAALETMIEGLGGVMKFGRGASKIDDITKILVKNGKVPKALAKVAGDSIQEGGEEVLSGLVNNYIRAMTYRADTSSMQAYFDNIMNADPATAAELVEQFILGATAGAMMGGVNYAATRISPTLSMSESIQEIEELREKGYNLNQRGRDTSFVENSITEDEKALMDKVNANFDKLNEQKANGNRTAAGILDYMGNNFATDEKGHFVSSKNILLKNDNASYGMTQREVESVITQQGNQLHQGVIEGAAAETKSVIQRAINGYNEILGRKNSGSRLKFAFADIADNADGTRSYGYLKDGVVVIDAKGLTETVDFSVLQGDKTQRFSVNAAMSTLLHEVFHFTEDTKSGQELRRILAQYATDSALKIEETVKAIETIDGTDSAQAKRQELSSADIVTQTMDAYADKSISEQVSEISARQLENLLFNERVIRRLTEDNSTLAKRILNNAKRVWDAVRGLKIAATKDLETLLSKTIKLYNKAIAEVGSGKRLTIAGQTQYSKRGYQPRDYSKITQEEYAHHAWATVNGVLSANESGLFMKKIGEKKLGAQFSQSADGSYMVSVGENGVGNKIVFTDGNWESPSVEKIVEIKAYNETFLAEIKELIYEYGRYGLQVKTAELFKVYDSKNYDYAVWSQERRNGVQDNAQRSGERNGSRASGEIRRSLRLTNKTDSDGRALTEGQAEFFKKSKAVDKNGKLQVVYHGTEGEFYTFDKGLRGTVTGTKDAKLGFFFTSSKDVALEYAVEAYDNKMLNLQHKIANGDREVLTKLVKVGGYEELAVTEDIEEFAALQEKGERFDHDIKELYLNIEKPLEEDWNGKPYKKGRMLKLLTRALSGDYDGVIIRNIDDTIDQTGKDISDVFVVFEPNQIKDVTNKQPTAGSDDIRYSRRLKYEPVYEIKQDSELAERIKSSNKSKYTVIKEYLVEKFGDTEFSLSDGKKAIMDKSDAKELSHKADAARTAELTNLKEVVEKAILLKEIENAEHNKFDAFSYYGVKLEYAGKQFAIVINVGRAKNDQKYHIYAITNYNEKGAVEELKNSSSRPVGNAIKDGSFDNIIRNNAENVNTFPENSLDGDIKHSRRVVSDKERASVYAKQRMDDVSLRIKKDLTSSELTELRKTAAYKELAQYIYDKYLQDQKEVSFKSIEENEAARILALKQALNGVRHTHTVASSNLNALIALRDKDMGELKKHIADANFGILDTSCAELIDELQQNIQALFKQTSDGKSILRTRGELLDPDKKPLLELVTSFENYLNNKILIDELQTSGEIDIIKQKVAEYRAYFSSLSGASYNDMPINEKMTFEKALSSFISDVSRVTKPTMSITIKGESISAAKYRDKSLRSYFVTLHKDKNGKYKGEKRALSAFLYNYFQNSVRPFEAIAMAENHAGGLEALYDEIRKGYVNGENVRADLEDIFLNFLKTNKKYEHKLLNEEVTIKHSNGEFSVSKGELIGLYLTLIQNDGFMHADASNALSGGIYFDNKNSLSNYRNTQALKFTEENVVDLERHFDETDKQCIEVIREFFKQAAEYKGQTDTQVYGVERLLGEDYYPLQTDESAKKASIGDKVTFYETLDPSGHLSINQSRVSGVKPLRVRNVLDLMTSYAKAVGTYYGVAVPIANMRIVYNSVGVKGKSIRDCIKIYSTNDFDSYLNTLLLNIQGAIKVEDTFIERQRQKYAAYAIAANLKSPIKALGGIMSLSGELKIKPFLNGVINTPVKLVKSSKTDFAEMCKYCPATRIRYRDRQATLSAMNIEGMSNVKNKVVDKLTLGIELVDKYTIITAWNGAKAEVGAVGDNAHNPELLKKAGELLDRVMDTTDRFEMTERNAFSRSPDALHRGWSMFTSAAQAQLTQFIDKSSTLIQLYHLKKHLPSMIQEAQSNKAKYASDVSVAQDKLNKAKVSNDSRSIKEAEENLRMATARLNNETLLVGDLMQKRLDIEKDIKSASHKFKKVMVSISFAIIASAALSQLMSNLMAEKDEEEWGGQFVYNVIDESIANIFSLFPLVGQLYNTIDGFGNFEKKSYNMSFWTLDAWNALGDGFNSFVGLIDGTGTKTPLKVAQDILNAIGIWTGIPTRNLFNVVKTALKPSDEMSYAFQNAFSRGSYGSDLKKAVEAGDTELAETITRLMMKDAFGDTDTKVVSTIRKLYEQGYTGVIPKTVSNSVRIDDVTYEMTRKQQARFKALYSKADETVERLIGKQSFVKLSAEIQADAIKWIYDYYYNRAKEDLSGMQADDERKALFGAYVNIETLAMAYSHCNSLKPDTDKNGKTISGTCKVKVVAYLNSLKTSAAEKYMILGYLGYSPVNQNARTLIMNFARKKGASKAEIAELLEECNIA